MISTSSSRTSWCFRLAWALYEPNLVELLHRNAPKPVNRRKVKFDGARSLWKSTARFQAHQADCLLPPSLR